MEKAKSEDDEVNFETLSHGPHSQNISTLNSGDVEERDELEFLRVENSLLRKKIKELEKAGRGEKHGGKLVVDEAEIQRIDELLKKAEAKAERHSFKKKIKETEDKLQHERKKIEQEEIRFQVDREIFAKTLKDDRDSYKYEVDLLVQKMTELQKERHELYVWVREQQERHLQEIRKLTRALGRTWKAIDDQKIKSLDVLNEVSQVQAAVFPQRSGRAATPRTA
ncbi:hypothetical protein FI667_g5395, partial [Globisporangium splendens]